MRNHRHRSLAVLALAACATFLSHASHGAQPILDTNGFDNANQLYEAGKYDQAKQGYDRLVKSGPWSANLYYNRGNAEWRLGQGGEAAADYERALELEPSHPQARANLDFVRDQIGAKLPQWQWWQRALGLLDANMAAVVLSVCGWGALFSLAAALTRSAGRLGAGVAVAICLLGAGYAGGCLWEANGVATRAVVIAKSTTARVAPAEVAPIADVLPAGSEVLAPEERGPWTYCTLPDGTRAWVPAGDLERVKPG